MEITVVLLAGGDSGRFWPLKDKHLINFFGKPLIYYSVAQLVRNGFKSLIVVVNKNNRQAISLALSEFDNISITYVVQTDKKGMAGAIISLKNHLAKQRILVIGPSDVFEDLIYDKLKNMVKKDPDGIIAGTSFDTYFPGGYLTVEDGLVKEIIEKPGPKKTPSKIVSLVFHYFRDYRIFLQSIEKIKSTGDDLFERGVYQLIKQGARFEFLAYKGFWGYLKYPWHILNLSEYFLKTLKGNKIKKITIDKTSIIKGDVYVENDVKILAGAVIIGPCYLGQGTIIGNNALVRQSMIGSQCVVGYATEITRSHIGNLCWFHSNYIGDSVIANNVSLGAGAVLANFRLDERSVLTSIDREKIDTKKIKLGSIVGENVRIGVNSSIMPGIKIGRNSFVSSHVCLTNDLQDDQFCEVTSKLNIKPNRNTAKTDFRQRQLKKVIRY